MKNFNESPLHPKLDEALKANDLIDVIRLKSGSLIITGITNDNLIDCDYSGCCDFATFLTVLVSGDGEDLHANLCPHHLKAHVDFATSHPAYIIH